MCLVQHLISRAKIMILNYDVYEYVVVTDEESRNKCAYVTVGALNSALEQKKKNKNKNAA